MINEQDLSANFGSATPIQQCTAKWLKASPNEEILASFQTPSLLAVQSLHSARPFRFSSSPPEPPQHWMLAAIIITVIVISLIMSPLIQCCHLLIHFPQSRQTVLYRNEIQACRLLASTLSVASHGFLDQVLSLPCQLLTRPFRSRSGSHSTSPFLATACTCQTLPLSETSLRPTEVWIASPRAFLNCG